MQASKWHHLLTSVNCPVTLLHDQHDPAYPITEVKEFISTKPNFTLHIIENAGQLVYYKYPKQVFAALDNQHAARTDALIAS